MLIYLGSHSRQRASRACEVRSVAFLGSTRPGGLRVPRYLGLPLCLSACIHHFWGLSIPERNKRTNVADASLFLILCLFRHAMLERSVSAASSKSSVLRSRPIAIAQIARHTDGTHAQVRCDAASLGVPCTNCVAFSIECRIPTPKRKKNQAKSKDGSGYVSCTFLSLPA